MSVAPPPTSLMPQPNDDQESWEVKPLGWRLLLTDRLLWFAIGLSFAIHMVLLAPKYGLKIPRQGDKSLTVSFRAASQSIAHNDEVQHEHPQRALGKTNRREVEKQKRVIQPSVSSDVTSARSRVKETASSPSLPSGQIRSGSDISASGSRRVTLTPGMKDYRYSQYLDDWRRKVERIGAMNYPDEARGKFFGTLVLSVALRPDGNVDRVIVVRSSGNPVLDDAAKRIVMIASPFAPFPPDIRKETDYLDITRTWTFTRSNALETR